MVRNGQTSAGKTRWRCKTCGGSSVQHRPDITRRAQAEAFAAWLLGPVPQYSTGGTGRSFRAQTAWCWNIEIPQPAATGEGHPVIMLDATYFQGWCLLVAYTGKHVIAWQWCDQEKKTAWQALLDPFHVVKLAGDALDQCRRRVQQELHARRGRSTDPLYKARRILHTGIDLLTPGQHQRLEALFSNDDHAQVEVTWGVYQKMVAAYRQPERAKGKRLMQELITAISSGLPRSLSEVITLGRTLKKRAADILAYFDHPRTSNGPTEAINGRLGHLRGTALGFGNLANYITRSLLETGGFKPHLHP